MRTQLALMAMVGLLWAASVSAQVTVPNTLVDGTTISAAPLNTNFSTLANHALDRLTGGHLAGNVIVDALVTFDGVDVGVQACITCNPTHAKLILSDTTASALTVGGGITAGTGAVGIVDTTGKIPAISSTYFTSLSGANLTGVALLGTANTFTAKNNFLTYSETWSGPAISAGTLTLDLSQASQFSTSLNAAVTIAITNPSPNLRAGSFTLFLTGDGTPRVVTWPASVKWAGGVAPTPTSTNAKTDIYQCTSLDGGATWFCMVAGQNF